MKSCILDRFAKKCPDLQAGEGLDLGRGVAPTWETSSPDFYDNNQSWDDLSKNQEQTRIGTKHIIYWNTCMLSDPEEVYQRLTILHQSIEDLNVMCINEAVPETVNLLQEDG